MIEPNVMTVAHRAINQFNDAALDQLRLKKSHDSEAPKSGGINPSDKMQQKYDAQRPLAYIDPPTKPQRVHDSIMSPEK